MKRVSLFAAAALLSANVFAATTYHFKTTTTGPRGDRTTGGIVTVDKNNMRVDIDAGDSMMLTDKSVIISKDGGKTLDIIDTSKKSYFELKRDQLLNPMGGRMQMSYANAKVNVTDQGSGGDVAGYPTRKYLVETSYDVNGEMMGRQISNHIETKSEVWATDKLSSDLSSPFAMRGFRTGAADVDKLFEAKPIKGLPLKIVTTSTTTTAQGTRTSTTETNITDVKETKVAASQFDVPSDYTKSEMPMPQFGGGRPPRQ